MSQNIFKIYDGRTNFWQWDTKQKLIVLDDRVTEVRFSHRNMEHSKSRAVHKDENGDRVVDVPDVLLQLPKNLIAYACAETEDGATSTIKAVKFGVMKQPIPANYVCEQEEDIEERLTEINNKINAVNDNKADDIYYDEDGKYIQLTANGKSIGSRVKLPEGGSSGITNCTINEDGHLIVELSDGRVIDAGYVGAKDGVTFIPHISDDLILSWTNDGGLDNPDPVDINPMDEWNEIDGVETGSDYTWEPL